MEHRHHKPDRNQSGSTLRGHLSSGCGLLSLGNSTTNSNAAKIVFFNSSGLRPDWFTMSMTPARLNMASTTLSENHSQLSPAHEKASRYRDLPKVSTRHGAEFCPLAYVYYAVRHVPRQVRRRNSYPPGQNCEFRVQKRAPSHGSESKHHSSSHRTLLNDAIRPTAKLLVRLANDPRLRW